MKVVLSFFAVILMLMVLSSCGNSEYKKISAKEAYNMMTNSDIIILDVREQYEYDDGHIRNAVLLPLGDIESSSPDILTDKNQTILIYCRSGRRSKDAALKLISLGYKNVYDFGGILDWNYEIVKN